MYTQKMCDMCPYHMILQTNVHANYWTMFLTVSLPHWEEFQLAAVKGVVISGGVVEYEL